MDKFNIDERIEQISLFAMSQAGTAQALNQPLETELIHAHIKQLLRDFYEYVKPERSESSLIEPGKHFKVVSPNGNQLRGRNAAIDEMDTKAKEAGL